MNAQTYDWKTINWQSLEKVVYKLQNRIYKASKRGDVKQIHSLQRLLMKSRSAKYLAVKRITQDNKGSAT